VFSNKIIFGLMILILSFLWAQNNVKSSILERNIDEMEEKHLEFRSFMKTVNNIEGASVDNVNLKSKNGTISLNSILKNTEYSIVIYQNGFVCNPCLEYIFSKWISRVNDFEQNLSKEIFFISNIYDNSVLKYLKNIEIENNYYIDVRNVINNDIIKSDLPVNFMFFVNSNRKIIYSTFFASNSLENFDIFLIKVNRFIL
jgi:hypothetical protein